MRTDGGAGVALDSSVESMMLEAGGGHRLYVETFGRPDGVPVVFLHGGPGSGCQPAHRALFDPQRFRAVLFDQRGAGRSTPHRSRSANTTPLQVADMEMIRETVGIERWLIVGGSWGATLGLAYAEAHPERVSGMVLRATFLGTRDELDFAFVTGPRTFYPQLHEDFLGVLPEAERGDPLPAYWRRILDENPAVHGPAVHTWHDIERVLSTARPAVTRLDLAAIHDPSRPLPSTPFMEAHYFSNDCFLEPGALLRDADRLAGIPGVLVQGRLDFLCPPVTAHALAARWQGARVEVVEGAGHGMTEPGVTEAIVAALDELARR